FNPAVGPSGESDAGLPASPNAAAVPIKAALAIADTPVAARTGIYKAAKIGIVPNDVPIHIVMTNPADKSKTAIINLESPVKLKVDSTSSFTAPYSGSTFA